MNFDHNVVILYPSILKFRIFSPVCSKQQPKSKSKFPIYTWAGSQYGLERSQVYLERSRAKMVDFTLHLVT